MTRPAFHVDVATTAPPNGISQPPGGIQTQGFPPHSKFASAWANWLFYFLGGWTRELDQSCLRAVDLLSSDDPQLLQGSGAGFSLPENAGLLNLVPDDGGAYVLFGRRVDLSQVALAAKYVTGFTLPTSTFVYAHAREETAFGGSSTGEILLSTNASEIGYQAIWRGTTNATDLISQVTLALTAAQWLQPVDMFQRLTINDPNDEVALDVYGSGINVPTIQGTCTTGATVFQANVNASDGTGFYISTGSGTSTGFNATMVGTPNGGFGARVQADAATTATAVSIEHVGTGTALRVLQSGDPLSGAAVIISATAGDTRGLAVTGSGVAEAIRGMSSTAPGANAFEAFLFNNAGTGYHCQTPVGSTTAARCLRADAQGAATAIEASIISSPGAANAALRLGVTGTAGSSLMFDGRVGYSATTFGGRMDYNTASGTFYGSDPLANDQRDFWSSRGGSVVGASINPSVVLVNNAYFAVATLALTDLDAPRRAGRRFVGRFSCEVRSPAAMLGGIDVRISDSTGNVIIITRAGAGTGATNGYSLIAVDTWQRTITLDFQYTIPSAGDRTFIAEVRSSTGSAIEVRDRSLVPFPGLI